MFDEIYGPEVRVTNVQYSCRHIYWMIESRERIELTPDFQRRQVWSNKQRSELIESILLGIPIPVIYLFESQFGTWQVLDGLQRLSAITDFMSGRFRLNGLTVLAELNGFVYENLPRKLQGVIDDYNFVFYVIQPPTSEQVKYEIMRRVNKGGTALNNQEMREMLYSGKATALLDELRKTPDFMEASHFVNPRRKADSCLVLRCVAFNLLARQGDAETNEDLMGIWNFRGDINEMLARTMAYINQRAPEPILAKCRKNFMSAMRNGRQIGGEDAFFFDSWKYGGRSLINFRLFEMLAAIYADDIVLSKPDKALNITQELKTYRGFTMLFRGSKADTHAAIMDRLGIVDRMLKELHHD